MIRAFFVSERVYARHIYTDYPIGEELATVNLILLVNVKGMRGRRSKKAQHTCVIYVSRSYLKQLSPHSGF